MDRDRCNVPCLFYATFNNKICVHYNVRLKQIGTSNLFDAMQQLCSAVGVECPGKGTAFYSASLSTFAILLIVHLAVDCVRIPVCMSMTPEVPWVRSTHGRVVSRFLSKILEIYFLSAGKFISL